MQETQQGLPGDQLGRDDAEVSAAARFALVATVLGVGFLSLAALWVGTCGGSTVDSAACGVPQRTLLALGAPTILLIAGVWSFVRTYQLWRARRTWWGWQGAGWFLMTLMLVTLTMGAPPIAGPAL